MSLLILPFGRERISATLPDTWRLHRIEARPVERTDSEEALVERALAAPVAAPALEDFVRGGARIAVIVPDKTRRSRTEFYLPFLLARLERAGIARGSIDIIFANGTHPGMTEAQKRAILTDRVFDTHAVHEHDSHADADMVHVGTTRNGTEVRLNRIVARADRVVATGAIVHHYFAGFGGGPKLLMPGVAAYATAVANHRRTLDEAGHFHPGCRAGNLDGNPVAEDIRDAVRFFPPSWLFATVLAPDGAIAHAVCGDLLAAHRAGCAEVDRRYLVPGVEPADITVVSCGGFPKDINLIQAHKALEHAHYATKPGGAIVFVAECGEGSGNASFMKWFDHASDEEMRNAVMRNYAMNGHTAIAMRAKARMHRIYYVGALPPAEVAATGMIAAPSLQAAIDLAATAAAAPLCNIMENGSLTVPGT